MGICFSCFSTRGRRNQLNTPYLKPFDSTKIVNARDADLLGTFPEALSDSLEDSEEIENGSSSPIQSPKNSTQTLDNVVVTPSLL